MFKKAFLLADLHYPKHDKKLWKLTLECIKREKPDLIILQGDQFDNGIMAHHNNGKPRNIEGQRLKPQYDGFDEEILKPLETVGSEIVIMRGNHEDWTEQHLDTDPRLEGMIEIENQLRYKERGIKDIKLNKIYKIGDLGVAHGNFYRQYTPEIFTKKIALDFGYSMAVGHFHTSQRYTKNSQAESKKPITIYSIPAMSEKRMAYAKNAPSRVVQGFAVVYYTKNSHFLNEVIYNGKHFIFNNQFYG